MNAITYSTNGVADVVTNHLSGWIQMKGYTLCILIKVHILFSKPFAD